jgi:hypothetical protein
MRLDSVARTGPPLTGFRLISLVPLQTVPLVTTDHDIVLHRYPLLSILTNRGSGQVADRTLAFTVPGLKAGDVLVNVAKLGSLDHADKYLSVGIGGSVRATIRKGQPTVSVVSIVSRVCPSLS